MKNLTLLSVLLISASAVLTACGGGESTSSTGGADANTPTTTTSTTPNTPTTGATGKLIIDNGRGTTNNQDTERVK